jgi:hypothetical protein
MRRRYIANSSASSTVALSARTPPAATSITGISISLIRRISQALSDVARRDIPEGISRGAACRDIADGSAAAHREMRQAAPHRGMRRRAKGECIRRYCGQCEKTDDGQFQWFIVTYSCSSPARMA